MIRSRSHAVPINAIPSGSTVVRHLNTFVEADEILNLIWQNLKVWLGLLHNTRLEQL